MSNINYSGCPFPGWLSAALLLEVGVQGGSGWLHSGCGGGRGRGRGSCSGAWRTRRALVDALHNEIEAIQAGTIRTAVEVCKEEREWYIERGRVACVHRSYLKIGRTSPCACCRSSVYPQGRHQHRSSAREERQRGRLANVSARYFLKCQQCALMMRLGQNYTSAAAAVAN